MTGGNGGGSAEVASPDDQWRAGGWTTAVFSLRSWQTEGRCRLPHQEERNCYNICQLESARGFRPP
jgi:hypothetical protein